MFENSRDEMTDEESYATLMRMKIGFDASSSSSQKSNPVEAMRLYIRYLV